MDERAALDIATWLRRLGLEQYESVFRENGIDSELLATLTAADLRELGMVSFRDRKRLLVAIAALTERKDAELPAKHSTLRHPFSAPQPVEQQAERRQLTVLFCDLVGSTQIATQLDPEELRQVITVYQSRAAEVIERWAGYVARYMGDGLLAYFGYPSAHEDDAERAILAGLDLVAAMTGVPPVGSSLLEIRVGIASGPVVVGDLVGTRGAQELGVVGTTPNLAARLQTLAEPGTVVIGAGTARLVAGLFDVADLGAQRLKGFPAPVQAWRVFGSNTAQNRFEARRAAAANATSLIGRRGELMLLLGRWAQAKGGEGCVLLLSGEPGIGKSRLAFGLAERLGGEPHTLLRYFCSPHHQASPLFPITRQLARAAGFARDDTQNAKLDKLGTLLTGPVTQEDDFALIADLLGLPLGERHSLAELSSNKSRVAGAA